MFNKNLTLLLSGRVVSDIGSSIQMLIMPLYILDIGGSPATVGLLSFASLIPILLVFPFGGVVGDRVNRKVIMVGADFLSGILIMILVFAASRDSVPVPLLLAIQALIGLLFGFFDPATKGIIPQLVNTKHLTRVNSITATLRILSGIAAPLLGVFVYKEFGITYLFLINSVSFLISGTTELFIDYRHKEREVISGIKDIINDLKEGINFINKNVVIKELSIYFLIVFAFIQPIFTVVLPLFFKTKLNFSETYYGYIQLSLFFGALIGSVLVGILGKEGKLKNLIKWGMTLVYITTLLFSLVTTPKVVAYLGNSTIKYLIFFSSTLFIQYIFVMFISTPVQTIIQKRTPEKYISRVFSIVGMITKGGMPLGALIYGLLLNSIEVHLVVISSGIIISIFSIYFINSKTIKTIN